MITRKQAETARDSMVGVFGADGMEVTVSKLHDVNERKWLVQVVDQDGFDNWVTPSELEPSPTLLAVMANS